MCPFESSAQRKFLWAKHPEIAKKWTKEHGSKVQHAEDAEGETYEPPKSGKLPNKGKRVLASVYSKSRKNGMDKERSSKIAWAAVRKAGFTQKSYAKQGELEMGMETEKEHTDNPKETKKIAEDHLREDPHYYTHLEWMKKKFGIKHVRHTLASHWKKTKAKHSGLGQIPTDYTKHLDGQSRHGEMPKGIARHSVPDMKEYAELDVAYMKEGYWRNVEDVEFFYPWEVIEKGMKTYEGDPFFADHYEKSGAEMGLVEKTYPADLNGEKWACAKVRVPETPTFQAFLDRIENGVVKYVSTTHDFLYDTGNEERRVKEMDGQAMSTVIKPEVDGARILSVKRHIKNPENIKRMRAALGRAYHTVKGG